MNICVQKELTITSLEEIPFQRVNRVRKVPLTPSQEARLVSLSVLQVPLETRPVGWTRLPVPSVHLGKLRPWEV